MKKIIVCSLTMLLILCVLAFYIIGKNDGKIIFENSNDKNYIVNTNALTMMYETEYESGEYQVSSDTIWPESGYTFNAELSKCENGGKLTWDDENKRVLLQTNKSDKCYVYFDKGITLTNYIINNVYVEDGENGLYYHDGIGSYTNANQEAGDNSYRYSGANPNNYVCFGSDEESCPEDNLYRIIGVFENEVKLIKVSSYGQYYWDDGRNNLWNESKKPTIKTVLNDNYFDTLNEKYKNMIETHIWSVGGINLNRWTDLSNAKGFYDYELGDNRSGYEETMKIGLMYVSEYGFAASPDYWEESLYDYFKPYNSEFNWMLYEGSGCELTITRDSKFNGVWDGVSYNSFVYQIFTGDQGHITSSTDFIGTTSTARPTFYLKADVMYDSGDGTQENPYRIKL